MAGYTIVGTDADEIITPTNVSPTVGSTGPDALPTADADIIVARGGKDTVTSGDGADFVDLGRGNDTYAWSTFSEIGAGSDMVYGGTGIDRATLGGYGAEGVLAAAPNGHVIYAYGVDIVDLVRVEQIVLQGTDTPDEFVIASLAGSHVNSVILDLSDGVSPDVPDESGDTVGLGGTDKADRFTLRSEGAALKVTGLGATLTIRHLGPADDQLLAVGMGGNDTLDASRVGGAYTRLVLSGGKGKDTLVGSVGDNVLLGDAGSDHLFGGRGIDILIGGSNSDSDNIVDRLKGGGGADLFGIARPSASALADRITDFKPGIDRVLLFDNVFLATFGSSVDDDELVIGRKAHDDNDHLIYNARTGGLLFDANGGDPGMVTTIAVLGKGLALSGDDFVVAMP